MSRRIATLWDNNKNDDNDEHESGQAFYAGGSEHSGQQILGGPNANIAHTLFESTRQSSGLLNEPAPSGSTLPIVFWRNGFTIGDETILHDYQAPQSRSFLDCLRRGETPPELKHQLRGGAIDVKLENKAHLEYKPEPKTQYFTGQGHRLGVPTPKTTESQDKDESSK